MNKGEIASSQLSLPEDWVGIHAGETARANKNADLDKNVQCTLDYYLLCSWCWFAFTVRLKEWLNR